MEKKREMTLRVVKKSPGKQNESETVAHIAWKSSFNRIWYRSARLSTAHDCTVIKAPEITFQRVNCIQIECCAQHTANSWAVSSPPRDWWSEDKRIWEFSGEHLLGLEPLVNKFFGGDLKRRMRKEGRKEAGKKRKKSQAKWMRFYGSPG